MKGVADLRLRHPHFDVQLPIPAFSTRLLSWLDENMRVFAYLDPMDQHLLRAAYLHRLLDRFSSVRMNERTKRLLCSRIGFHLQRELTLLLLGTPTDEHATLFSLPNEIRGLRRCMWQASLLGASGEAFVIRSLVGRAGAAVHLPTAQDDLFASIDLFWFEAAHWHGITIKTRHWRHPTEHVHAVRVRGRPQRGSHPLELVTLDRIWVGTRNHARNYGAPCRAVGLCASVPYGSLVHLRRTWQHVHWPNQILSPHAQTTRRRA